MYIYIYGGNRLKIFTFRLEKRIMATNNANPVQWHTIHAGAYDFRVPVRYQNPTLIGQGAFGVVM